MAKCVVYRVDQDDLIVDQTEYDDIDKAIELYFNGTDGSGNRFHIEVAGHDPPYKVKPRKYREFIPPK